VALVAGILLGAGTAQAATVLCQGVTPVPCDSTHTNAVLIFDLLVPGGDSRGYNVEFVFETAEEVYGAFPGTYTFDTNDLAREAVTAIADLFNNDAPSVLTVGPGTSSRFAIGYEGVGGGTNPEDVNTRLGEKTPDEWLSTFSSDSQYSTAGNYAKFEVVPEPGTAALLGLGFAGLGVAGRRRRAATHETA
jgi:hypothetical protein